MEEMSTVHEQEIQASPFFKDAYPENKTGWLPAQPPKLPDQRTGRLMSCSYCGSMHPSEVATAIQKGAHISLSDVKYGWPHKAYLTNVVNPHEGMDEIRKKSTQEFPGCIALNSKRFDSKTGDRLDDVVEYVEITPAKAYTEGKFYMIHLKDATPEDKAIIEKSLGLTFTFEDGKVFINKV